MKNAHLPLLLLFLFLFSTDLVAQTVPPTQYQVSFPNASHHEAEIQATFQNPSKSPLQVLMPRSSPGRYALHEFAKNVYNLRVTDKNGNPLPYSHPNPHQWDIPATGTIVFSYTLFADRADGTYSQIDPTHAHLNMPATFVYAKGLEEQSIGLQFKIPEKFNWKAATQLPAAVDTSPFTFTAPNLQYFMDSPVELAPLVMRSWKVKRPDGKEQTIEIALHHTGTEQEADAMAEATKRIVEEQRAVFGELPRYDYGRYTFIACYMPHVSGDGMEHRNSTILTSPAPLRTHLIQNLSTVSHEFFHAWNVERIRPMSLEPFQFQDANMSSELWLAEGFTSYYGDLTLQRAGIITIPEYLNSLQADINAYLQSPGARRGSPVYMSQQAPFTDAARSVDPTNRHNTFLSYYTYGSVVGLYLDLSLRSRPSSLTLDQFMQYLWQQFGKNEKSYTLAQIENALADFTQDKAFASGFFAKYVYGFEPMDLAQMLAKAGIGMAIQKTALVLSPEKIFETPLGLQIMTATTEGTPFYVAGLDRDDVILTLNGKKATEKNLLKLLEKAEPGTSIALEADQRGQKITTNLILAKSTAVELRLLTDKEADTNSIKKTFQQNWLNSQYK